MSAIAKPMIYSAAVTNPVSGVNSELVPADMIKSVGTLDTTDSPPSRAAERYQIIFSILGTDGQTKEIKWKFADSATRDAELVKVYNTVAAVVA